MNRRQGSQAMKILIWIESWLLCMSFVGRVERKARKSSRSSPLRTWTTCFLGELSQLTTLGLASSRRAWFWRNHCNRNVAVSNTWRCLSITSIRDGWCRVMLRDFDAHHFGPIEGPYTDLFCTDRVKELAEREGWTNVRFDPIITV
jgi:hypothetical protein